MRGFSPRTVTRFRNWVNTSRGVLQLQIDDWCLSTGSLEKAHRHLFLFTHARTPKANVHLSRLLSEKVIPNKYVDSADEMGIELAMLQFVIFFWILISGPFRRFPIVQIMQVS